MALTCKYKKTFAARIQRDKTFVHPGDIPTGTFVPSSNDPTRPKKSFGICERGRYEERFPGLRRGRPLSG